MPDQRNGNVHTAVDAGQIRNLLSARFDQPYTIGQFNAYWSTTTGGLRSSLQQLSLLGRWQQAYEVSQQLWQSGDDGADAAQLFADAGFIAALQRLQRGDANGALSISNQMTTLFPNAKPWCSIDAQAYLALDEWGQAMNGAELCLRQDSSLYQPLTPSSHPVTKAAIDAMGTNSSQSLVQISRSVALAANADVNSSITLKRSLLLRALAFEEHPAVLKSLGDIEYEAQQYELAQQYYRRAIALDGSIAGLLGNRLQNSEQRASTAPITEVDFENRRGALVVTAYLNDHPQSFRLLLDTGATFSAVSTATILRLGLSELFANGAPLIQLESAAGPIYVQKFTLDSMRIGNARVNRVPVVILEDLDGYDGLVGLSFLRHFGVNLDQQAGKLILTRQ